MNAQQSANIHVELQLMKVFIISLGEFQAVRLETRT